GARWLAVVSRAVWVDHDDDLSRRHRPQYRWRPRASHQVMREDCCVVHQDPVFEQADTGKQEHVEDQAEREELAPHLACRTAVSRCAASTVPRAAPITIDTRRLTRPWSYQPSIR